MQGVGFSLQEIKKLLDLRERPRDACREFSELLKTKLAKVRGTIGELTKLERELAVDSTCARRSAASLVIFWTAAVIVLLIILFPQIVASLIAR